MLSATRRRPPICTRSLSVSAGCPALAKGLSGSVGVPGAVTVNYDAGQALDALSALSAEQDSLKPESLYVAAFQELQESFTHLAEAGINGIVVFVDDLDRCLPGNALDVLESMKLFFDLAGFIFVVGLDEDVIDRAVLAKFAIETSSHLAEGEQASAAMTSLTERLGREYAKKIFQVPYSLPAMLPQQLTELLESMYKEAGIEGEQLADLHDTVRPYVNLIAVERRVNPREVKRFINSYTLQTLIRSDLNPDVILSLQTLAFRRDWEDAYDAINADSELFIGALRSYRTGYPAAFEDTLPDCGDSRQILIRSWRPHWPSRWSPSHPWTHTSQASDRHVAPGPGCSTFSTRWGWSNAQLLGVLASKAEEPDISAVTEALDRYRNAEVKGPNPAITEKVRRSPSDWLDWRVNCPPWPSPHDAVPITGTLQVLAAEIERFKAELRFIRDAETF